MKTPRQILFQKHAASMPKLDRLRAEVLRQHGPRTKALSRFRERNFAALAVEKLWAELIWPCRRVWAGLAAVWFVLLGFQLGAHSPETPPHATSAAALATALEQRRQLLAELFRPTPVAPPPKPPPQAHAPDRITRRIA